MSTNLQASGFRLPGSFPDTLFEAVKDRIIAKVPTPTPERENLAGGHNGVRYRLRACADYSEDFIKCVRRAGDAPPLEDRYQQERQIFGFFVSGIAALDSFNFFIYFSAAHLRPNRFPAQKPGQIRAIARKSTAAAFAREFSGEAITNALTNMINDPMLNEWDRIRNVLAHRAAPGSVIYASIGTCIPTLLAEWKINAAGLKIDENLTPPRLEWLVATLADLVVAADRFSQDHF